MDRHTQRQQPSIHGADLDQVGRELAAWRRTHRPPTRIPERVWERAGVLAAQYGVGTVAQALRLNYTEVKRRMESSPSAEPTATFIELLPTGVTCIGECALEVESSRGNRMRVVMKSISPACLTSLIRDFAE
jgi:hypothetical protein